VRLHDLFEFAHLLFCFVLVLDGLLDREPSGVVVREEVREAVVDLPRDARPNPAHLEGVLRVRLQVVDALRGVAEVEVLADPRGAVASHRSPVVGVGARIHHVRDDVLPVPYSHRVSVLTA